MIDVNKLPLALVCPSMPSSESVAGVDDLDTREIIINVIIDQTCKSLN